MVRSELQRYLEDRDRDDRLAALVARQPGPHAAVAVLRAQGYAITLDDLLAQPDADGRPRPIPPAGG